jgi:tellurite methyltransferase
VGCGEGKNAHAFAQAGADVVAVDCSELALANGRNEFSDADIQWTLSDAKTFLHSCAAFDVVLMYGLLHCLPSLSAIASVIDLALQKTRSRGYHIVATFNDGPHDLSAHPGFTPTLASHDFYLKRYYGNEMLSESSHVIHETHPHNGVPHFHSLTRLITRRAK